MNYLLVDKCFKYYADKTLFEDISFSIDKGQKVALIARNGTGKSTLLKIIAGEEEADGGSVYVRKEIKVAYLNQDPHFPIGQTVMQAVFDSDTPIINAIKKYEACMDQQVQGEKMQKVLEEMDRLNAWDYESYMKQILSKLKIDNFEQQTDTLSGGQQKRLALAKVLIDEPDFLILDEPTNHLDLEMIEWLEEFLGKQKATLLMVTHDRYFLERVCNEIIELDEGTLYRYKGNYSYFLEKKEERHIFENKRVDSARRLFKKELDWMRRSPKARGTKAKARVDSFHDLKKKAEKSVTDEQVQMEIKSQRLGSKILEIHNLGKSYGDIKILEHFNYKFKRKDRVGIIGNNGTGKSTFLRLITQQEKPDTGKVVVGSTIAFGYYAQDGMKLKEGMRVIDAVRDVAEYIPLNKGKKLSASQLLERFLFPPKKQQDYVSKLSGGEKRRLYLLTVLMENPNFLILDEPTNDLDIVTLNVLEDFLADFEGCLIIVSHDRYFMDKLVEHVFVFDGDGVVSDFPGNYTQYRAFADSQPLKGQASADKEVEKKPVKAAPKRKLSYNEQREFDQLEKEIDTLEEKKKALTQQLENGNLNHEVLIEIGDALNVLIKDLERKSDRWLELAEYVG